MQYQQDILDALGQLPAGIFGITSAYEGQRNGCLVRSVQVCADDPQLISVAVRKGHTVETLIRDSHMFAICRLSPSDKLSIRALETSGDHEPEVGHDPFATVAVMTLVTGSPVPRRALMALDCEVVRHFDLEADHELYIGEIRAARVFQDASASGDASAA